MIDVSDYKIAEALLQHGSKAAAAKSLGMNVDTLYTRIQKPNFTDIYTEVKSDIIRTISAQVTENLPKAFEVIANVMNSEDTNPATRLQAAQTIINSSVKFSEILKDIEAKTEQLGNVRRQREAFGYAV